MGAKQTKKTVEEIPEEIPEKQDQETIRDLAIKCFLGDLTPDSDDIEYLGFKINENFEIIGISTQIFSLSDILSDNNFGWDYIFPLGVGWESRIDDIYKFIIKSDINEKVEIDVSSTKDVFEDVEVYSCELKRFVFTKHMAICSTFGLFVDLHDEMNLLIENGIFDKICQSLEYFHSTEMVSKDYITKMHSEMDQQLIDNRFLHTYVKTPEFNLKDYVRYLTLHYFEPHYSSNTQMEMFLASLELETSPSVSLEEVWARLDIPKENLVELSEMELERFLEVCVDEIAKSIPVEETSAEFRFLYKLWLKYDNECPYNAPIYRLAKLLYRYFGPLENTYTKELDELIRDQYKEMVGETNQPLSANNPSLNIFWSIEECYLYIRLALKELIKTEKKYNVTINKPVSQATPISTKRQSKSLSAETVAILDDICDQIEEMIPDLNE